MAQITAGEVVSFTVDGVTLTVKIEDASKSDMFLAKVQQVMPQSTIYQPDHVYEFNRKVTLGELGVLPPLSDQ